MTAATYPSPLAGHCAAAAMLLATPVGLAAQPASGDEKEWKAAAEAQSLRPEFVRNVDGIGPPLTDSEIRRRDAREQEEDEANWSGGTQRPCDGSTSEPAVCLTVLGAAERPLGEPVKVQIDWRNLPDDAGLYLELTRAAPAGLRWRYVGLAGPIVLDPIPLSGSGSQVLEWSGTGIGCDPTDFPMWCEGVASGHYMLRGTLFDTSDFHFLGHRRPTEASKTKSVIARSQSGAFSLSGTPDLHNLLIQSSQYLARELAHRGLRTRNYVHELLDHNAAAPITWGPQLSCATLELLPPLTSQMDACIPTSTIDDYGISAQSEDLTFWSTYGFAEGVLPEDEAEVVARHAVMDRYRGQTEYLGYPYHISKLPDDRKPDIMPSWLNIHVSDVAYMPEGGGYWLFSMDANLHAAGGDDIDMNDMFVRVANDGSACLMDERDSDICS